VKAIPDKFQSGRQACPPVWPVMRAVAHAEFVFDAQFIKVDMQAAIILSQEIIIAAINHNAQIFV
jgi:hypothetical protein